jgi:hypothetical protein
MNRRVEARWRAKPDAIAELSATQRKILASAADAAKPGGGQILYSTCSLLEAENEAVVRAVLADRADLELVREETTQPRATVRDGGLWINNYRFDALVLPAQVELPAAAAGVVERFGAAGGRVVRDTGTGGPADLAAIRKLHRSGSLRPACDHVVAGRFVRDGREMILLANVGTADFNGLVSVAGETPWWLADPATGAVSAARADAAGEIPVSLPALASVVLVEGSAATAPAAVETRQATGVKVGAIAQPLFSAFMPDSLFTRLEDAGTRVVLTTRRHVRKVRKMLSGREARGDVPAVGRLRRGRDLEGLVASLARRLGADRSGWQLGRRDVALSRAKCAYALRQAPGARHRELAVALGYRSVSSVAAACRLVREAARSAQAKRELETLVAHASK